MLTAYCHAYTHPSFYSYSYCHQHRHTASNLDAITHYRSTTHRDAHSDTY